MDERMKHSRLASALAVVAVLWLAIGAGAQVTVTNLAVAQRPGTKLVDITYDVASTASVVVVSLEVSDAGTPISAVSLTGSAGFVSPGAGKSLVWDMGADWSGSYALLSFTLTARLGTYMVIDLSAGSSATSYPVTYLDTVPAGGWTDEYKTTKLVLCKTPKGSFTMGSPVLELGRNTDETQHSVTLTKHFYIGMFETTQRQWERVIGNWPSWFNNATVRDSRPVENISYNDIRGTVAGTNWPANSNVDANSFMGRLRARTGKAFDLPTEAQWEYACRAGTTNSLNTGFNLTNVFTDLHMSLAGRYRFNGGSNITQNVSTNGGTAKVGTKSPNARGLRDMHGNVNEICLDWYGSYPGNVTDPKGAVSGTKRVERGGDLGNGAGDCRSAFRDGQRNPSDRVYWHGFRVALTLP